MSDYEMFSGITTQEAGGETYVCWEDWDMGLRYVFYFVQRVHHFEQVYYSAQVLSRVFAVAPNRMAGRDPKSWRDSMRWNLLVAEQHLPNRLQSIAGQNI